MHDGASPGCSAVLMSTSQPCQPSSRVLGHVQGSRDEQLPLLPQQGGDQSGPPQLDMDASTPHAPRVDSAAPVSTLSRQSHEVNQNTVHLDQLHAS